MGKGNPIQWNLKQRRQQQEEAGTTSKTLVLLAKLKITRNLQKGKEIHEEVIECGKDSCVYIASALVNMYAKCGSMVDAHRVFDTIKHPDVVSWSALILGYAENGEGITALDLFARMKSEGCAPNRITFLAALRACTVLALEQDGTRRAQCREWGKLIHLEIGYHLNAHVQTTLIDMYSKCGSMIEAHQVFDSMEEPDEVAWNALILGYAENGEGVTALNLFAGMKARGRAPNRMTFVAALKACTAVLEQDGKGKNEKAECLELGKKIHLVISCHSDIYVQSTLIDMYSKCGSMEDARHVFNSIKHPDVVLWNALILGYAKNGEGLVALDFFARMASQGCSPNRITFVAALKACSALALEEDGIKKTECLKRGKQIHSQISACLGSSDIYVQCTLMDMYANCGCMFEARQVFDSIEQPNVVSWNALIMGYTENGEGATALDLLARMRSQGYAVNSATLAAAFKSCTVLGDLQSGRKIHAEISNNNEWNAILVTSLVDFYAKCGDLADAKMVFDLHPETRSLKTWNALLAGYSHVGDSKVVFELFEGMQDAGFVPNSITFLCILNCCSHSGLVQKANEFFENMSSYGTTPSAEHYNCMVDLLGRSNKLDDALTLLRIMPFRPDPVTWMIVLGACHKWKNTGIGKLAFMSLVSFENKSATAYVLMAQIYGTRGMWEEQEEVLQMRK